MTKHTYFRANDGTLFIPEPIDSVAVMCCNNAMAYDACIKYDLKTSPSNILIENCELSTRALKALKRIGVKTISDIGNHIKSDVLQHGVGRKTIAEIEDFMIANNLKWKKL